VVFDRLTKKNAGFFFTPGGDLVQKQYELPF